MLNTTSQQAHFNFGKRKIDKEREAQLLNVLLLNTEELTENR